MRRLAMAVVGALLFTVQAGQAWAVPVLPILSPGEYKFKFTDAEAFVDSSGNIVNGPVVGGHAIGVIDVTQILNAATNTVVWNKGDGGAFLSAVFNTPTITSITGTAPNLNVDAGTGAFVNIYLNPSAINFGLGTTGYTTGGCSVIGGTCFNSVSNVAGGSLYLTLAFEPGIIPTDGTVGLSASFTANTNPLTGHAQAYLDVTGGSAAGLWDTNGFVTNFGDRDFFLQNDFCTLGSSPACVLNAPGFQLRSEDPTLGNIPEPGTLVLLGVGLTGLAFMRRKRA